MNDYDDSEGHYAVALQEAINGGTAWKLEGSAGRAMMAAIKDGACLLGKQPTYDYYGNRIPSRDEVKAGTMGSYEYVADIYGIEYADAMSAL